MRSCANEIWEIGQNIPAAPGMPNTSFKTKKDAFDTVKYWYDFYQSAHIEMEEGGAGQCTSELQVQSGVGKVIKQRSGFCSRFSMKYGGFVVSFISTQNQFKWCRYDDITDWQQHGDDWYIGIVNLRQIEVKLRVHPITNP